MNPRGVLEDLGTLEILQKQTKTSPSIGPQIPSVLMQLAFYRQVVRHLQWHQNIILPP